MAICSLPQFEGGRLISRAANLVLEGGGRTVAGGQASSYLIGKPAPKQPLVYLPLPQLGFFVLACTQASRNTRRLQDMMFLIQACTPRRRALHQREDSTGLQARYLQSSVHHLPVCIPQRSHPMPCAVRFPQALPTAVYRTSPEIDLRSHPGCCWNLPAC
ncbi:hypothetical protein CRV24_008920 [Beauveria bassiana]|nr:hypothetical protein CRV24_008920 [Beauveria bassiana]